MQTNTFKNEVRKYLTLTLLSWSLKLVPDGEFKIKLAEFCIANIQKL